MEGKRLQSIILALLTCSFVVCGSLNIAAFNVQVFGRTKFSNAEVVSVLTEIVHRYDIILIQEIRDSSEQIIHDFTSIVNSHIIGVEYGVNVSERLGRTTSKEQYAFLYRRDRVELVETHQYEDTDDVFEREPFSIMFRSTEDNQNFFLMGIHVKPSDAATEIEALAPAYDQATEYYQSARGVIMGDMNAGCSYLSRTRYESLELVQNQAFNWLIDYDVDTTVSLTQCAYDRIVVHQTLGDSVVAESARAFNFTAQYSLTADEASAVSDHYPVEFQLQLGSVNDNSNDDNPSRGYTCTSFLLLIGSLVAIATQWP